MGAVEQRGPFPKRTCGKHLSDLENHHGKNSMNLHVCKSCGSCRFFSRIDPRSDGGFSEEPPQLYDDSEQTLAAPILSTDADSHLSDYGRCLRNPPQFFSSSLNGEWPIVHDSSVCGEYRPDGSRN